MRSGRRKVGSSIEEINRGVKRHSRDSTLGTNMYCDRSGTSTTATVAVVIEI